MRLFLATSFPESVVNDLRDRLAMIKPRLPSASWVRSETQHATLAFLGDQPETLPARLAPLLRAQLQAMQPFQARLRGSGVFPNARHARVGWAGLDPENAFVRLSDLVRAAVSEVGVTLDRIEFRAHLTVMRMRTPWPPASIALFNNSLKDYVSEPFTVDEVTLFSSELDPKGAIHTPVETYHLGGE